VSLSWIDPFWPRPGDRPILGLAFARHSLDLLQSRWDQGTRSVEWSGSLPLEREFFIGTPPRDTAQYLAKSLAPFLEKNRGRYVALQVALPDPSVRAEVFELECVPKSEKVLREFLTWHFNPPVDGVKGEGPVLASQVLGEEGGKVLLLGSAFDASWLKALKEAFRLNGVQASVIDAAFRHRFNLNHDVFGMSQGGGGLAAFERDYWNLVIWDSSLRPRLIRSKWWPAVREAWTDPPFEDAILEMERTIRAYVYSGGERSVGKLFLSAPVEWMPRLLDAFNLKTGGHCVALSSDETVGKGPWEGSPAVAAVAR